MPALTSVGRRLLPLYIAAFFQGFVLWYVIEKLYMRGIGFDDAGIGLMVAAYSAIMLLVETPSGILADRWSRKGVLIIASIALALSSIVCGLSNDIPTYLIGAAFWGIFFALYTGTYDSIVYDTLLEDTGSSKYEKYYGRIQVLDSVALVIGSLLGGLVADQFGLQQTFFWSVPLSLAAVVALLIFKEPTLHKSQVAAPIKEHVQATFRAVLRKRQLVPILVVLIALSAISNMLFEFNQLWYIALAIPVLAFGPVNALLLATLGLGGLVPGYLRMHTYAVMRVTMVIILVSALGLVISRHSVVIVLCQVVLGIGVVALGVLFNRLLHDSLSSNVRAGASSAVSTLGRVVLIPLSLLFGFISTKASVFNAAWIFAAIVLVIMVFIVKTFGGRKELQPVTVHDEGIIEEYQK